MVGIAEEEVIDMFVDMSEVGRWHGFEGLRRYASKAGSFGVLEFRNCLAKFIPGDQNIEFPESTTLGDLVKEGWIGATVSVVVISKNYWRKLHIIYVVISKKLWRYLPNNQ